MTEKRFTLRDYYNALLNIEEVANNPTLRTMTEGRLEQLDKKNGSSADRKPTAKQTENEKFKAEIMGHLPVANGDFHGLTVGEINKTVPCCVENGFTSSKTTALVTQLYKANLINRVEIKGRAYFSAKA